MKSDTKPVGHKNYPKICFDAHIISISDAVEEG